MATLRHNNHTLIPTLFCVLLILLVQIRQSESSDSEDSELVTKSSIHDLLKTKGPSVGLQSESSDSELVTESSIHDLLKSKGLPVGLFPKEVESFTLYDTGLLEVFLRGPCLTKFDTMAFYESTIRANLTYGGLTGVEGLSQEELFLWLPVKDIIVDDPKSGLILFDIGLAHKQLSLSLFEDPPDCKSEGVSNSKNKSRKEIGFHAEM